MATFSARTHQIPGEFKHTKSVSAASMTDISTLNKQFTKNKSIHRSKRAQQKFVEDYETESNDSMESIAVSARAPPSAAKTVKSPAKSASVPIVLATDSPLEYELACEFLSADGMSRKATATKPNPGSEGAVILIMREEQFQKIEKDLVALVGDFQWFPLGSQHPNQLESLAPPLPRRCAPQLKRGGSPVRRKAFLKKNRKQSLVEEPNDKKMLRQRQNALKRKQREARVEKRKVKMRQTLDVVRNWKPFSRSTLSTPDASLLRNDSENSMSSPRVSNVSNPFDDIYEAEKSFLKARNDDQDIARIKAQRKEAANMDAKVRFEAAEMATQKNSKKDKSSDKRRLFFRWRHDRNSE